MLFCEVCFRTVASALSSRVHISTVARVLTGVLLVVGTLMDAKSLSEPQPWYFPRFQHPIIERWINCTWVFFRSVSRGKWLQTPRPTVQTSSCCGWCLSQELADTLLHFEPPVNVRPRTQHSLICEWTYRPGTVDMRKVPPFLPPNVRPQKIIPGRTDIQANSGWSERTSFLINSSAGGHLGNLASLLPALPDI